MVKCSECGYLALRKIRTRELVDAERTTRESGEIPKAFGIEKVYDDWPLCFQGEKQFADDLAHSREANRGAATAIKETCQKERYCAKFREWREGFTPKDHRELEDRERAEAREEERRKREKKDRRIDILILILGSGFFTLLGVGISRLTSSPG